MDTYTLLDDAKSFVRESGKVIMDNYEKNIKYKTKSTDMDIVTEIDILSENIIINRIKEKYPEHCILSEEQGLFGDNEYIWVIDPIDGTTNYFHGMPYFAISIGLLHNGESIVGVVYSPKLDEMFWAVKGNGAYLNDKKISVSNESKMSNAIIGTGFPYDRLLSTENGFDIFNVLIKKAKSIRVDGSASLDICYVACGRLSGYCHLKLGLWDIAASELILEEAGGKMIKSKSIKADGEEAINVIVGNSDMCSELFSIHNKFM